MLSAEVDAKTLVGDLRGGVSQLALCLYKARVMSYFELSSSVSVGEETERHAKVDDCATRRTGELGRLLAAQDMHHSLLVCLELLEEDISAKS